MYTQCSDTFNGRHVEYDLKSHGDEKAARQYAAELSGRREGCAVRVLDSTYRQPVAIYTNGEALNISGTPLQSA